MNRVRRPSLDRPMSEGVRRWGFRKWYEHELLSSHMHMLLAVFAVIAMLASLEALRGGSPAEQLMNLLFIIVCAVIGFWALRRYLYLLMRAEDVANQAVCSDCGAYGRFEVVADDPRSHETRVCCLKCAHQWTIAA